MNSFASKLGISALAGVALLGASHLAVSREVAPSPMESVAAPVAVAPVATVWANPPAKAETRTVRLIPMVETAPARAEPVAMTPIPVERAEPAAKAKPVVAQASTPKPAAKPVRVARKAKPVAPVPEPVVAAQVPAPQQVARVDSPLDNLFRGLGMID